MSYGVYDCGHRFSIDGAMYRPPLHQSQGTEEAMTKEQKRIILQNIAVIKTQIGAALVGLEDIEMRLRETK